MNVAAVLKAKGRAVATASPMTTLQEIATQLAAKKIGAIVLVDDAGGVVGIISERDVIRAVATTGEGVLGAPAANVMTRTVVSCTEGQTIEELMTVMTRGRFRHVPVIENGKLTGIVSIGDVVKHHIAEVEMEVSAMRGYLATG